MLRLGKSTSFGLMRLCGTLEKGCPSHFLGLLRQVFTVPLSFVRLPLSHGTRLLHAIPCAPSAAFSLVFQFCTIPPLSLSHDATTSSHQTSLNFHAAA